MDRILVTAATGTLGAEVVRRLLARGREVKAGTRDPERAARMFGDGVEVVELDYLRTETYDAAVMWADRIFLVPPPFDPRADENLIPLLDWAVSSGTEHVVLLSAMGVEKIEYVALHRVEKRVREIGVPFTFLRPNWFMQNFLADFLAEPIRATGRFALAAGAGAVSFVDARDVADAAAVALCGAAPVGEAWTLTGPEALTHARAAGILSAATGREIRYENVDDEAMRAMLVAARWPAEQAEVALGLLRMMRQGGRAEVTDAVRTLLGRQPTDLATFATEHAGTWR
jgi:uncharacterized protein YbjT (DUF2867 family)